MKKTPLPKLIKWVVSGAIHPIALFMPMSKQAIIGKRFEKMVSDMGETGNPGQGRPRPRPY